MNFKNNNFQTENYKIKNYSKPSPTNKKSVFLKKLENGFFEKSDLFDFFSKEAADTQNNFYSLSECSIFGLKVLSDQPLVAFYPTFSFLFSSSFPPSDF